MEHWYEYLAAAGALLFAVHLVVKALKPFAKLTETKADDQALDKADELLDKAEDALGSKKP